MEKLFDDLRSKGAEISWTFGPDYGLVAVHEYPGTDRPREEVPISWEDLTKWANETPKEDLILKGVLLLMGSLSISLNLLSQEEDRTDPEHIMARDIFQHNLLEVVDGYL